MNADSNEERVRRWRERRRLGISSTDHRAAARAVASASAERLVRAKNVTVEAIVSIVLEALAAVPDGAIADRRSIYEAISEGWDRGLQLQNLEQRSIEFQRQRLRSIIRFVEEDVRNGVSVFDPAYDTARIAAADARLATSRRSQARRNRIEAYRQARRKASRGDVAFKVPLPTDDAADLVVLRPMIADIHARQAVRAANRPTILSTIFPILSLQVRIIQSDSRVALLWSLMGPAVLMTLIATLYIISGVRYVLNMDVATFAMTGATTWIMLRIIVFRSSGGFFSGRAFFNIEPVRPLAMALSLSIVYLLNYMIVFVILITLGHSVGLISLPDNPVKFVFYLASFGLAASSLGLIFGSIAVRWHYFLRFAPVLERAMELFSGVFFVSEQLPKPYRKYILWMPFCHGIQLLRSAYFSGYKSEDASPTYYFVSLAVLFLVALGAERMARPFVEPM